MSPCRAFTACKVGAWRCGIEAIDAIGFIIEEEAQMGFYKFIDAGFVAVPIMIRSAAGEVVIDIGAALICFRVCTFCIYRIEDGFPVFIEGIVNHTVASVAAPTLEIGEASSSCDAILALGVFGDHIIDEFLGHVTVAGTGVCIIYEIIIIDRNIDIRWFCICKIGTCPSVFFFTVGGATVPGDGVSVVAFFADVIGEHPHGDAVPADGFAFAFFWADKDGFMFASGVAAVAGEASAVVALFAFVEFTVAAFARHAGGACGWAAP